MGLFEGLFGFEKVLLVLGILLFVVSLIGLLVFVFQRRPIKNWSYFVALSIVMVAWPSLAPSTGASMCTVSVPTATCTVKGMLAWWAAAMTPF